jgi:RNA polymerase sigma-70 factor (ECF subfamily)
MAVEGKQDALRVLHARGREAWPDVELDLATFSTLATRQLGDGALDDVRADELYLAIACAARVDQAIAAFDSHYLSGLAPVLIRRGRDTATAIDVVQAVRVRFLVGEAGGAPKIAEYNGRGSLATWLRVASLRIAISADRKVRREIVVDEFAAIARSAPDLDLLRLRFHVELESAFRSTFEALTPRERTLLRYQVVDRLGIDRIAALYGIHRATAARWVAHARETLITGVRRALQDRLLIDVAELESLFHQIRSELELSLRWFLTPARSSS